MLLVIVYKRTLVSGTPLNLINTYHLVRAHAIVCTYLGFALQNGIKVFFKLNSKSIYQSDIQLVWEQMKQNGSSQLPSSKSIIWAKFRPIKKNRKLHGWNSHLLTLKDVGFWEVFLLEKWSLSYQIFVQVRI